MSQKMDTKTELVYSICHCVNRTHLFIKTGGRLLNLKVKVKLSLKMSNLCNLWTKQYFIILLYSDLISVYFYWSCTSKKYVLLLESCKLHFSNSVTLNVISFIHMKSCSAFEIFNLFIHI